MNGSTPLRRERRRGLAAIAVAVVAVLIGLTAGITTGGGSDRPDGAARWVQRERPAGAVLTVEGWVGDLADGDRLRIVTGADDDLLDLSLSEDPGSVVVPSDSPLIERLRSSDDWSLAYRDAIATVLIHDGALPVDGAT